jgi:hypothetical protein
MKNMIYLLLLFLILTSCKLDLSKEPVAETDRIIYFGKITENISAMEYALYKDNAMANGRDIYEVKMDYQNSKLSLIGSKSDGSKCQFLRSMAPSENDFTIANIKSVNLCTYDGPSYDCAASYLPSNYFIIRTQSTNYYLDQYFYYCRSSLPAACDGADLAGLDGYLTTLVEGEIANCL